MSNVLMCGFEAGTLVDLTGYSGASIQTTGKRTGTYCVGTGDPGNFYFTLSAALSEFYIGFGLYITNGANHIKILQWRKSTTVLGTLYYDKDAKVLKMYTGDLSSLKVTGTKTYNLNTLYYVECHVKIDDSAGVLEMRGDLVADGTPFSGDTKPGSDADIDTLYFQTPSGGNFRIDDLFINSIAGSVNNSWPSGLKIYGIVPSGAGNRTELTPSAGSNYQCVDEVPVSSTDYVGGNTNALGDTYAMGNLPAEAKTVAALCLRSYPWKTGVPAVANIKNIVRPVSTDRKSSNITLSASMAAAPTIWELSPETGVAWTTAEVDGMEAGFELAT